MGETMKAVPDLLGYLENNPKNEALSLAKGLSFHWSNWVESILFLKAQISENQNHPLIFFIEEKLNHLKNKTVWVCNKAKTLETTYYKLCESYLDSRLRMCWFDREEELLYSDVSEVGPFQSLSSMKWFKKECYELFVQRKILTQCYPLRSLRLSCNFKVDVKFSNHYAVYNNVVEVTQFSRHGLLFKFNDRNFINKIKNSQHIEFHIPMNDSMKIEADSLDEYILKALEIDLDKEWDKLIFRLNSNVLQKYSNCFNVKRSSSTEFFFYAGYRDFTPIDGEVPLEHFLAPLCHNFELFFKEALEAPQKLKVA